MVGATGSGFRTTVVLDGNDVDLEEASVIASLGYHKGPRWGITGGIGAILGGTATVAGHDGDIGPGVIAEISGSWLAAFEKRRRPFVMLSLSLGASTARAVADDDRRRRLTAGDIRAALLVGKSFGRRLVPYVAARAFAGPVYWRIGGASVVGGDAHHYTVGGGLTVRLPARLDLIAEILPLGEQSATAGLTYRY
jgi:hypothetical protein